MQKVYLFGAGINCIGVIKFLQRQNIIAIIDSDRKKIGNFLEGVPIISFEDYLDKENGEEIFITSYFYANEIGNTIEKKTKNRYYKSPYMQMGYFDDADDIIEKLKLDQNLAILFYSKDPIAQMIAEGLQKRRQDIHIQYIEESKESFRGDLYNNCPIVVTCEESEEKLQEVEAIYGADRILYLSRMYMDKFCLKNQNLSQFKNIHKGKRCFLIGNGPSLSYQDLEVLHNHHEICFGANRIYLAYENTEWRPDYYVAVDYFIVQKDKDIIEHLEGIKFIRHFYKSGGFSEGNSIFEFQGKNYALGKPEISFDIEQGIYCGNTVIYDMLQLSLYMGFEEIYLLGVDMTSGIRPEEEGAHFYKTPDKHENLLRGNRGEIMLALEEAGRILKEKGYLFKNATRGGELEVLDRVDFDSLF